MSIAGQKSGKIGGKLFRSENPLPPATRKWRRMVRTRDMLFTGWLGGLTVTTLPMLTEELFHCFPNGSLGFAIGMGITLGSFCVFMPRFDAYVQQTFAQPDRNNLGCWIEILLPSHTTTMFPTPEMSVEQSARTQTSPRVREWYFVLKDICQLPQVCCMFLGYLCGAERGLSLCTRLYQNPAMTRLGIWIARHLDGHVSAPAQTIDPNANSTDASQQQLRIRAGARTCLLEQLPQLREESAQLLRLHERHSLYKSLFGNDRELIRAVLRIVPLFHDAHALTFVQPLVEGAGIAAGDTELQAEAQSCLQRLQEILARNADPHTLLRASHVPKTAEEQLLKPAYAANATDPSELLRAERQP